jgi:phosphate transport system substrate-binding protein
LVISPLPLVNSRVKDLLVKGVSPDPEKIRSGEYPLNRRFYFVSKGAPVKKAKDFVDFVLSEEGQRLLEEEGLIALK